MTDASAEVLAAEQIWTDAHLRSDVATIASLMAPDYAKYVRRNGAWQIVAEQSTELTG